MDKDLQDRPTNNSDRGLPAEGYVRLPQILRVLPIGRSSWWLGIKQGRYPKQVRLGPRTVAWRVQDIRQLLASFD